LRRVSPTYLVVLGVLAVIAAWALLVYFGVPPFDNISIFLVTQATGVIILLIASVVGGAFVGMLLAQRILGNREFSLFEKTVLQSLGEIRDRLDKLESGRQEEEKLLHR